MKLAKRSNNQLSFNQLLDTANGLFRGFTEWNVFGHILCVVKYFQRQELRIAPVVAVFGNT